MTVCASFPCRMSSECSSRSNPRSMDDATVDASRSVECCWERNRASNLACSAAWLEYSSSLQPLLLLLFAPPTGLSASAAVAVVVTSSSKKSGGRVASVTNRETASSRRRRARFSCISACWAEYCCWDCASGLTATAVAAASAIVSNYKGLNEPSIHSLAVKYIYMNITYESSYHYLCHRSHCQRHNHYHQDNSSTATWDYTDCRWEEAVEERRLMGLSAHRRRNHRRGWPVVEWMLRPPWLFG